MVIWVKVEVRVRCVVIIDSMGDDAACPSGSRVEDGEDGAMASGEDVDEDAGPGTIMTSGRDCWDFIDEADGIGAAIVDAVEGASVITTVETGVEEMKPPDALPTGVADMVVLNAALVEIIAAIVVTEDRSTGNDRLVVPLLDNGVMTGWISTEEDGSGCSTVLAVDVGMDETVGVTVVGAGAVN